MIGHGAVQWGTVNSTKTFIINKRKNKETGTNSGKESENNSI
jgi:hypothetical protein